ncbi:MAG: tetratricopeptide repeat protein [Jhaorihella sp.]
MNQTHDNAASTFVVLGMHRSGTSALARCVNLLGARICNDLMAANSFNATGYWEPRSVVRLNDEVIGHFDRHWADPKPFPGDWTGSPAFERFATSAEETMDEEFGRSGTVVVKDPRLSRVLPVWGNAIGSRNARPVYLIACRNPLEVARSLAFRDKLSVRHGLQLWLSYMLEAEYHTRGSQRRVIHYEDLLRDWRQALGPVAAHAGLPGFVAGDDPESLGIDRFLSPGARHHAASQADVDADPEIPGIVKHVYDLFRRFDEGRDESVFVRPESDWRAYWSQKSPGQGRSACVDRIPKVQLDKSKDLLARGRIAEALVLARTAAAGAGDDAKYQYHLGILNEKAGDLTAAVGAFRRAVALDNRPVSYHLGLARALRTGKNVNEAIVVLRKANMQHPGNVSICHQLGICLEQAGDLEGAAAAQREALAVDDTPIGPHLSLARVLRKMSRPDEAVAVLRRADLRHPDNPAIRQQLGLPPEEGGDISGANAARRQT